MYHTSHGHCITENQNIDNLNSNSIKIFIEFFEYDKKV